VVDDVTGCSTLWSSGGILLAPWDTLCESLQTVLYNEMIEQLLQAMDYVVVNPDQIVLINETQKDRNATRRRRSTQPPTLRI
jgi:hypothetical protein